MNKKFTTFLASAMLVSAFSVGSVAAYVGAVAPAEDCSNFYYSCDSRGQRFGKRSNSLVYER